MDEAQIIPFPTSPSSRETEDAAEPKVKDAIGDVLREERHDQGRTLADVADEAAVSVQYLSEIERGRKDVSSDLLESVTKALEIPIADVLERAAKRLRVGSKRGGEVMLVLTWLSEHLIDDAIIECFLASQNEGSVGVSPHVLGSTTKMASQQRFSLISNSSEFGSFESEIANRAAAGF